MNELISIVVPVYNGEKYLTKCLDSLKKQSYKSLEIIIVNDGSVDNSELICKKYCENDSRFKYIFQKNSGVSSARNNGIKNANGLYIGFVDSDDWIEHDMYESLYELIKDTNADIAVNSIIFYNEGGIVNFQDDNETITYSSCDAIKEMYKGTKFAGQLWNKLYKKNLFDDYKIPEDIFIYEDMVTVCKLFEKSKLIAYQGKHKYHYIYNGSSAMHAEFKTSYLTIQKACDILLESAQDKYSDVIEYAQMTMIIADLSVAEKLYMADKLDSIKYKELNLLNKCGLRLSPF